MATMNKLVQEMMKSDNNNNNDTMERGMEEEKKSTFVFDEFSHSSSNVSASDLKKSEFYPLYQSSEKTEFSGINGLKVLKDPFLGHVLIIHNDSNEMIVINITTHLKLCQLQNILSVRKKKVHP
jgi:hypothetical protein